MVSIYVQGFLQTLVFLDERKACPFQGSLEPNALRRSGPHAASFAIGVLEDPGIDPRDLASIGDRLGAVLRDALLPSFMAPVTTPFKRHRTMGV